jgi:hypothetical protein
VDVGGGAPRIAAGGLLATVRENEKGELFESGEEGTDHGVDVLLL